MAKIAWALLAIASGHVLPSLLEAGDAGIRAHVLGGTVAQLPGKSEGSISLTEEDVFLFRTKKTTLRISYQRIHTVEYGQRVSRRYMEAVLISPILLLSKTRKHFVTIGYSDDQGRQQALVFRVSKKDVRPVLAALEARTGRKVEFQDDEARKSGKG